MAHTASQKLQIASLARAPLSWLNWRPLAPRAKVAEAASASPPREVLDNLIEAEIIPRLMLIHRDTANSAPPVIDQHRSHAGFSADDVDRFARQAVDATPDLLVDAVTRLLHEGVSHDDILLKLLAPAARRLGEYWDEDSADFADVTVGLMKLQRVLDCVTADAPVGMDTSSRAPRILLTPAPGEQHVFGVTMVGEFFARSGWCVRCEPNAESEHLVNTVSEQHFDIVGISASSDIQLKAFRSVIQLVRTASLNPAVMVLVGGQAFNSDPALARRVGADAMATDGVRAVVTAERLIDKLPRAEVALQ